VVQTPDQRASPVSEFIEVGGFDDEGQHRAENLRLPAIANLTVTARVQDALDTAIVARKGVAVIGPKGAGKTAALMQALAHFREIERQKRAADHTYSPRGVVRLRGLRAKAYRDCIIAMYKAVTGTTLNTATRGRRKQDDELLDDLVFTLTTRDIVALVLDEVEFVTDAMFSVLRDLMSEAADRDPTSHDATTKGYGAAGIGVLVVGTPSIAPRLAKLTEIRERWARTVEVDYAPCEDVPGILVHWFPAFSSHVERVGARAWAESVKKLVTHGAVLLSSRDAARGRRVRARDDTVSGEALPARLAGSKMSSRHRAAP
jgi:hypothetical protein